MRVLLNAFGMCLCVLVNFFLVCTLHHLHCNNVIACVWKAGFFIQLLYRTSIHEPRNSFFLNIYSTPRPYITKTAHPISINVHYRETDLRRILWSYLRAFNGLMYSHYSYRFSTLVHLKIDWDSEDVKMSCHVSCHAFTCLSFWNNLGEPWC